MGKPASNLVLPNEIEPFLIERGSMTRKMEQLTDCRCVVNIKEQGWLMPSLNEQHCLQLERKEPAWIREVILNFSEPYIFARSVFPKALIESDPRFENLDTNPLGAILFSDPAIQRGEIEVMKISRGDALYDKAMAYSPEPAEYLWARRSVFYFYEFQLLVCEVFFPNVATLQVASAINTF